MAAFAIWAVYGINGARGFWQPFWQIYALVMAEGLFKMLYRMIPLIDIFYRRFAENRKLCMEAAAEKFDDDPSVYNLCRKDYPDVLAEAASEPFSDLLDAGCGTGAMLGMFQRDCPDKNYTGLDLSEKMIETANKKHMEGIRFVVGDCEDLPFAENSFDVVTCSMSFHHYPNPEKFFKSLHRVLRPDGRLILRDMASGSRAVMWFINHIEIPLCNSLLHKGDVHVYSGTDIQRLCDISGLKLELYEIRKGLRLHCVVRKPV